MAEPVSRHIVDAAFEAMAGDPDYQTEAVRTVEEFCIADWEALQLRDPERPGEVMRRDASHRW